MAARDTRSRLRLQCRHSLRGPKRRRQPAALVTEALEARALLAVGGIDGLGVAGDSLSDEYAVETYNYASNWVEQLAATGLNFGAPQMSGEPRRTGFAYNWARAGATSTTLLTSGQHVGLADQIASNLVSHALLAIGQNDFAYFSDAYAGIYNQSWPDLVIEEYVDQVVSNIHTALSELTPGGADLVLANLADYGVAPATRFSFPDAAKRDRVTAVIADVNARLSEMALDFQIPLVDTFSFTQSFLGTNANPILSQTIGGVEIRNASIPDPNNPDLTYGFVDDGIHPSNVPQAVLANLFTTAFNSGYGTSAPMFTEQQMVQNAGLTYGGSDTFNAAYGSYVDLPPTLSTSRVGDLVWHDQNQNGLRDVGEPGVPGVSVQLVHAGADGAIGGGDDELVQSTKTDGIGHYRFTGVAPGSYYIQFAALPPGYHFASSNAGSDSSDNNADPATGATSVFVVTAGLNDMSRDAGLVFREAELSGQAYEDLNLNGRQDPNEPGLDGRIVALLQERYDPFLDRTAELAVAVSTTASVDRNLDMQIDPVSEMGLFALPEPMSLTEPLAPGTYKLVQFLAPGTIQTDPGFAVADAAPLAGPGSGWLQSLSPGTYEAMGAATVDLDLDQDNQTDLKETLVGRVRVQVGANATGAVPIEIVSLALTGNGIRLRAGDGTSDLQASGPLHSPGQLSEHPQNPSLVESFFDLAFQVAVDGFNGPFGGRATEYFQTDSASLPRLSATISQFFPHDTSFGLNTPVSLLDINGDLSIDIRDVQFSVMLQGPLTKVVQLKDAQPLHVTLGTAMSAPLPVSGIEGRVFEDRNANGVADAGEPGLAGQTVYVDLNHNGRLDLGEPNATTRQDDPGTLTVDETGLYAFPNLAPGRYIIRTIAGAGLTGTGPQAPSTLTVLDAPGTQTATGLGRALAPVSENRFAVGADTAEGGNGAFYVYDAQTHALLATGRPPSPSPQSGGAELAFGGRLAALGDARLSAGIVVGANGSDAGTTDAGNAYVYDEHGNLLQVLNNPNPGVEDRFGFEVTAFGTDHVFVAADRADVGPHSDVGRVDLFNVNTGRRIRTFANPSPQSGDRFGAALAQLGTDRVVIGMPQGELSQLTGGARTGEVNIFDVHTGTLLTSIANPDPSASRLFGTEIAVLDSNRLLVGAPEANGESGRVYMFDAAGTLLQTFATTPHPDRTGFGAAIAVFGPDRIAIAETLPQNTGSAGTVPGSVYVYDDAGRLITRIVAPQNSAGPGFGSDLLFLARDQLLIGSGTEGKVYVMQFSGQPGGHTVDLPLGRTIRGLDFSVRPAVLQTPGRPRLLTPRSSASNRSPEISWTAVPYGTTYELSVTAGQSLAIYETDLPTTRFLPKNALEFGTFTARVRAYNADGIPGTWSNDFLFEITADVPVPGQPNLLAPLGPLAHGLPTFQWSSPDNADVFDLWVEDMDSGALVIRERSLTENLYVPPTALRNGNYEFWVRSFNSEGEAGPWSLPFTFSVQDAAPAQPTVLAPAGLLADPTPEFRWSGSGAHRFDIWVAPTSGGPPVIREQRIPGDVTSFLSSRPLPDGAYRTWVRGISTTGLTGPWSAPRDFTVLDPAPSGAPTINAPLGTLSIVRPTFSWDAVPNADVYDLWVDNLTTGQNAVIRNRAVVGTSFTPLVSLPEGSYRTWVRAFNEQGDASRWSDPEVFQIDVPTPGVPTPMTPTGTVSDAMPLLTWTSDSHTATFDLWVNRVTPNPQLVYRNRTATGLSHPVPLPLTEGQYEFWIRGFNAAGEASPWSAALLFTVDLPTPVTPMMTGPSGTPVTVSRPRFEWTTALHAATFDLWVDSVTNNVRAIVRDRNIQGTAYVPRDGLPEGDYRAWVRGINAAGEPGGWSPVFPFTISVPAPDVPVIEAPTMPPDSRRPLIAWSDSANATFYDVWIDNRTTNERTAIRQRHVVGTTFVPTADLAPGNYRLWVRAANGAGEYSAWSTPRDFTIVQSEATLSDSPSGPALALAIPAFEQTELPLLRDGQRKRPDPDSAVGREVNPESDTREQPPRDLQDDLQQKQPADVSGTEGPTGQRNGTTSETAVLDRIFSGTEQAERFWDMLALSHDTTGR